MRFLIIATLMLSSFSAVAESNYSEFFWQPDAGKHVLIPSFSYSHRTEKSKASGNDLNRNSRAFGLQYAYGYSENVAFAIATDFSNTNTAFEQYDGLGDLRLHARVSRPLWNGNIKYGAELSLSPEDVKEESTDEYNAVSGRHLITPYLGYEYNTGTVKIGGGISYDFALSDIKEEYADGTSAKFSGLETLGVAAFVETDIQDWVLGGTIRYTKTSDAKNEDTGVKYQRSDVTSIGAYFSKPIKEGVELAGGASYGIRGDTDTRKDGTQMGFSFGVKFTL